MVIYLAILCLEEGGSITVYKSIFYRTVELASRRREVLCGVYTGKFDIKAEMVDLNKIRLLFWVHQQTLA